MTQIVQCKDLKNKKLPKPNRNNLYLHSYAICIRPALGMTCITYKLCSNSLATSFTIDDNSNAGTQLQGSQCTEDYIIISGASMGACSVTNGGGTGLLARFCGRAFTSALVATTQDSIVCGKN